MKSVTYIFLILITLTTIAKAEDPEKIINAETSQNSAYIFKESQFENLSNQIEKLKDNQIQEIKENIEFKNKIIDKLLNAIAIVAALMATAIGFAQYYSSKAQKEEKERLSQEFEKLRNEAQSYLNRVKQISDEAEVTAKNLKSNTELISQYQPIIDHTSENKAVIQAAAEEITKSIDSKKLELDLVALAVKAAEDNKNQEAYDYCTSTLALNPINMTALFLKGALTLSVIENKNTEEQISLCETGISCYEKYLEISPKSERAKLNLLKIRAAKADISEDIEELKKIQQEILHRIESKSPGTETYLHDYAQTILSIADLEEREITQEEFEKAENALLESTSRGAQFSELKLAELYAIRNNTEKSIYFLNRALSTEYKPTLDFIFENPSFSLIRDDEKFTDWIKKNLSNDPSNPNNHWITSRLKLQ